MYEYLYYIYVKYIYIYTYVLTFDLLYLIKASWCRWIIFINQFLILFIFPFCFNIRLKNCLQVKERSSIFLFALEILRLQCSHRTFCWGHWSRKMASLQCQSQIYLVFQTIWYEIVYFKCKYQ